MKVKGLAAVGLAACAAGLCAGWFASTAYHRRGRPEGIETRSPGSGFTSPLLECDMRGVSQFAELRLPKKDLQKVIDEEIAWHHIRYAAVYFRDLTNGPWFGINENQKFAPASLLKVPLMISYLKWAEEDPGVLGKRLCFRKAADQVKPEVLSARRLQLGQCYTVEELVERMIVNSDNEAKDLLLSNLGMERYVSGYRNLGVEAPTSPGDTMSVKEYASFFRILFNASYLSRGMSEKALRLLSKVEFKTGLRAGLPAEIPLSHKFGERMIDGGRQLHDCGIVYYPGRPYLLCVMSRGSNLADMDNVIENVSRAMYRAMLRQFPIAAVPQQPPSRSVTDGRPRSGGAAKHKG